MENKFAKQLKELRAMSHEERMEIVKALVEEWKKRKWKEYERRR
ncbi:MAG: hypothetical protein ACRD32_07515 [Nitrososphaerales archaeon]